jgi:hypothetical protein
MAAWQPAAAAWCCAGLMPAAAAAGLPKAVPPLPAMARPCEAYQQTVDCLSEGLVTMPADCLRCLLLSVSSWRGGAC